MTQTQRLWAPWRGPYVSQIRRGRHACIFCAAKRARADRAARVVHRGREVFCLLNRYPYNAGHLMVAPYRHVGVLSRLRRRESAELLDVTAQMVQRLTKLLRPQGFNVGINLGRAAGVGIPGHLHLHIVPRWVGDTNFMPVVGGTRVVSHALDALQQRLTARDGKNR